MIVRDEAEGDRDAIRRLVTAAFAEAEHASGTEADIVDRLRHAGRLHVSLVAEDEGEIIGHVAFSPVSIDGAACGWFGLGPVAVRPDRQRFGIGAALIRAGIERLRGEGAAGCVVLGDPAYYERFGFIANAALRYPPAPAAYFRSLALGPGCPSGTVAYDPAFD